MSRPAPDSHGWFSSIRLRILAVVIGLLVLSSLGSVLLLRALLFERLDDEVAVSLTREVREFELLSRGNDPQTGQPFAGDLDALFDVYFDREVPDEGETLLSFVDGELHSSRRAQDAATAGQLEEAIDYWLTLEEPEQGRLDTPAGLARYAALPVEGRGRDGLLVVANFPDFERAEIDAAVRSQIGAQLAALVLASALSVALAGRVLRPLRTLASTARMISETDLTRRISVTGRDEASQIAVAFNDMLARLEGAFRLQRQFLDDTSHELRTPLTVIRGHLELFALDATPQERAQTLAVIADETARMSRIVDDLFLLARADQPGFVRPAPLDAAAIVRAAYRKATALGDRDWQLDAPTAIPVVGDRDRLTQALLQLADNAVKFTAPGQLVELGARASDGQATLWVRDGGLGVAPQAAERIFERFQRGTAHRGVPGAGLGLAIVTAIAEAHGGRVRLVPHEGPGAWFELTIPAAPRR